MNILTFDIEEWFHILDNDSTKTEREWSNYESRIHKNMDRIFSMLAESEQNATFFCLGWVAKRYPDLIKKIHELGYEIGTHSHMHQLVYEQKPKEFKADLEQSINSIQEVTGKKVTSYRSPGFSLTENCTWALDILAEAGITCDCSIFPARRAHGGFAGIDLQEPFVIKRNGYTLKEFPMSTFQLNRIRIVFSGGGYFRLLPYSVIKQLMKKEPYVMTYFHPRDFDSGQPVIQELSYIRKFKSYYGLNRSSKKLQRMLKDFEFHDIKEAIALVNWDSAPIVKL